ncbi:MAG: hypothetical protein RhofKO_35300 [Rhodothermales bacterium]
MTTRNDTIRKHLADMQAVEAHILAAVKRQLSETEELATAPSQVAPLLRRIESTLTTHTETLNLLSERYDGETQANFKKIVTEFFGMLAGIYDKVREHEVSRMLRDDYTALSLAAMGYTAMHSFGLAIGEDDIASMSQRHLEDLTPLLMDLSRTLPYAVVQEVAEENDFPVDTTVGARALENTQRAWQPEVAYA